MNTNYEYFIYLRCSNYLDDKKYAFPTGRAELKSSIEWIKDNYHDVLDEDIIIYAKTNLQVKTWRNITIAEEENSQLDI